MRKSFTSTIDEEAQKAFKEKCSEAGLPQNIVLEAFMREFASGRLELKMALNKAYIDTKN